MKLKILVIDPELTTRQRRLATALAVPILVAAMATVASAEVDKTWMTGEVLTAADLNATFAGLDQDTRSPLITSTWQPGTGGIFVCNSCAAVAATTSKTLTVSTATTIRIKAFRNGNSRVWVGLLDPSNVINLPNATRLTAVRIGG